MPGAGVGAGAEARARSITRPRTAAAPVAGTGTGAGTGAAGPGREAARPAHHFMLGMRLDHLEVAPFVEAFIERARTGEPAYCCVPDVHQCMLCHDSESHRAIVNGADYVMSDSTVLQAARALRHGVPRIRTELGTRLMLALCARACERGVPIALVGGRDGAALERIRRALSERCPGLAIAYSYAPPFRPLDPAEEEAMLEGIAASGARLVFLGIGCPKQEQWMGRYSGRVAGAMIGVGAAFDTIGGTVRPAPALVHAMGLEWLFRLAAEPRRLWRRYLHSAPRFVWLLAADRMRAGRSPDTAPPATR